MATDDKKQNNAVFSAKDLYGKTYSDKKSPVQRGVSRKQQLEEKRLKKIPWQDREKLEEKPLENSIKMYKVRTEAREIFENAQKFHRENIHENKKMSPEEKFEATNYVHEWAYSDYLKNKK